MCVVKVDMALIENSAVRLWVCLMRKKNNLLFLTLGNAYTGTTSKNRIYFWGDCCSFLVVQRI